VGLHENETRKRAFGVLAEEYDACRPRYPAALFERVAVHARIAAATRALEIGCGTGIATLPFAEMDCAIRCLELSDGMAAVARRKLARFPHVAVETTAFEEWTGKEDAFDLVYCAQAWHWLPPEPRYRRTRDLLRPGGTLAVFANWDVDVLEVAQPAYRRHLGSQPHAGEPWRESFPPDIEGGIGGARAEIERSRCFGEIEFHRFPWARSFNAAEYVRLLRTYSDVSTLPPATREPFLADIAAAIEEAGGTVARRSEAILMLARPAK
jgi:SAM-dependent methyltransferase